ncbi:MAG: HAD-IA family hydrolase [Ruminococcaceae bacterium]|nr:HAD-IA family hydrolase [Oscillospiraceae bacterium]
MSIKKKAYDVLIGKKPVIRRAYVKYKAMGISAFQKVAYLGRLYLHYYILGDKKLKHFSEKREKLYCKGSESGLSFCETPEKLAEKLCAFDTVSFDIFDTLIYRPFAAPVDLFYIVGAESEILDFTEIRQYCERKAREEKLEKDGNTEIDIDDIYNYMSNYAGSMYMRAEEKELKAEYSLCFANPYMKKVWDILMEKNVPVVITSDMYLKEEFLEKLLEKNGFTGYRKLFVSNSFGCSKYDGGLYEVVKEYLGSKKIAHVGDNSYSDGEKSKEHGFTPFLCKNPNTVGNIYRPDCFSAIIGSAYGGIVNTKYHCGLEKLPSLYEYGYGYSGIFVFGYCNFIRKIRLETGADKVLFLARDGDLLQKIYIKLFPEADTEYFLWSRLAATKLCFEENTLDFIRRFVYHKYGDNFTAGELLEQMDLGGLKDQCSFANTVINEKNYRLLSGFIYDNKDKISKLYEPLNIGAKKYFESKLKGCSKVLAVDVGWAGSGAAAIDNLCRKWGIDTEVIGVNGGMNDSFAEQPNASEGLLQAGKLFSYCFSQNHNRDIYLTHDSASGHNIFFEMLLGSEDPSLKGFDVEGEPVFSENESGNAETVRLIHQGASDFCSDWIDRFRDQPYMMNISGSDAYAPFLYAIRDGGRYFSHVLGECLFNSGVGTKEKNVRAQI